MVETMAGNGYSDEYSYENRRRNENRTSPSSEATMEDDSRLHLPPLYNVNRYSTRPPHRHANRYPDGNSDRYAGGYASKHPDQQADGYLDRHRERPPERYLQEYKDRDPYIQGDRYRDRDPYRQGDGDLGRYRARDRYPDRDLDRYADIYRERYGDRYPERNRSRYEVRDRDKDRGRNEVRRIRRESRGERTELWAEQQAYKGHVAPHGERDVTRYNDVNRRDGDLGSAEPGAYLYLRGNRRPRRVPNLNQAILGSVSSSEMTNKVCEDLILEVILQWAKQVATSCLFREYVAEAEAEAEAEHDFYQMLEEIARKVAPEVAKQCLEDTVIEDIVINELIDEVTTPLLPDAVAEVVRESNTENKKHQIKQLNELAGERLLEEMCIEQLLLMVGKQAEGLIGDLHNDRLLDGTIMEILLDQMNSIGQNKNSTLDNEPLASHHLAITGDIVLDTLLEELRPHAERDLDVVDELEQPTRDLAIKPSSNRTE